MRQLALDEIKQISGAAIVITNNIGNTRISLLRGEMFSWTPDSCCPMLFSDLGINTHEGWHFLTDTWPFQVGNYSISWEQTISETFYYLMLNPS